MISAATVKPPKGTFRWYDYQNNVWKSSPRFSGKKNQRSDSQVRAPQNASFEHTPQFSSLNNGFRAPNPIDLTNSQPINPVNIAPPPLPVIPNNQHKKRTAQGPPENEQPSKDRQIRQSSPKAGPSAIRENWAQEDGFGLSDDEMDEGLNQTVVQTEDAEERDIETERMVSREEFSQFIDSANLTTTKIKNITKVFNETVELDEQLKKMSVSKGTSAERNTLSKNLAELKKKR